jgi:hypothetical protein
MEENIKEELTPDVVVNNDQSGVKDSEETEKEPTLSELNDLAKGLQKGYTLTRQELAEIRENIQAVVDATNKQTGATSADDEYLTTGKLREILSQQQQQVEAVKRQADTYIESTLNQLRADGIVKTKDDEDALIKYAIDKKETDLRKAADRWIEIKQAREEGKKEVAKVKVRQEEGSKVGTSSKVSGEEQEGISIKKLQDWKRDNWF